jgi:hypothetical protein
MKHNAFIAHCSGVAKGSGTKATNALAPLERLQKAITSDFELSCSTISKGDSYYKDNYMGKIGVILFPKILDSITFASATDGGTLIDPSRPGRRLHVCNPISINNISDSIINRSPSEYNELCIYSYKVVGVFIDPPVQFSTPEEVINPTDLDIHSSFPNIRFYGLRKGELLSASYLQDTMQFSFGSKINIDTIYSVSLCQ